VRQGYDMKIFIPALKIPPFGFLHGDSNLKNQT